MGSRQFRNEARNGIMQADELPVQKIDSKIITYNVKTPHITANLDGSITIDKGAYVDDVAAFICAAALQNPNIDNSIVAHLQTFIDLMDERAVSRHGYSNSPEEKAYVWKKE